jgi:hypothetical protein
MSDQFAPKQKLNFGWKKYTEGKSMREIYIFKTICSNKINLFQPIYLLILIVPLFSVPDYLVEKVLCVYEDDFTCESFIFGLPDYKGLT